MYSRGKGRLTIVSLLALVLVSTFCVGTANALPTISSLSIMDATYNGTTLHVVFDRPVTVGTLALTDFVFSDSTDATGQSIAATGYSNVITISGAGWVRAPRADTTKVGLLDTLAAAGGTNWGGTPMVATSRDYSGVQVHSGPVIVGAFPSGIAGVTQHADDDAGNDTLAIQISHPLALVADSLFYIEELSLDTAESWTVVTNNPGGANPDTVFIAWRDTSIHKMMQPGYSKIAFNLNTTPGTDTAVTGTAVGQATSGNAVRIIDADGTTGPRALFGLYNENAASTSDDEFFLVTNQDIVIPAGGSNTFPTIATPAGTGWAVAGGENFVIDQRDSLNAHQTRNYLRTSLNTGPTVPVAGDLVRFTGVGVVESATDSIGNVLIATVPVASGPGILQAWGVESATDSIYVRISEILSGAATASDFRIDSVAANTAGWAVTAGGVGPIVTLAGGDFVHGCRIGVDSSAAWSGATSTNANPAVLAAREDGFGYVPVFDATNPNATVAEDTIFERNPGGGASHAYIQFEETVDNADYYLLYTRVDGPITQTYFQTNINVLGAIPIPNPNVGSLDTVKVIANITPGLNDVSGTTIEQGRRVYFGVAPVDCDGNIGSGTGFTSFLIAGPVACPRDTLGNLEGHLISLTATDTVVSDDNIWIVGHKYPEPDTLVGDSLAVDPYDYVVVFRDAGLSDSVTTVQADSLGSFSIPLVGNGTRDEGDANGFIYLESRDEFNNTCGGSTAILNDRKAPGLPVAVWDPMNPERVYGPGDPVNIYVDVFDTTTVASALVDDISSIMSANVVITTYHTPPETIASATFTSWGADGFDNDGDWYDGDASDTNTTCGDVGAGAVDVSVFGVNDPYTMACIPYHHVTDSCSIGSKDIAEPYIDENSNGSYDRGEPFTDLNGNKVHDAGGDTSIDYLDTAPTQSLACEGDSTGPFVRRENHIFHAWIANLDQAYVNHVEPVQSIKTVITLIDNNGNETVVEDSFMITLDNLAPEQSQFTRLARRNGLIDSTGSGNLVPPSYPEDNCYDVANYVDFDVTAWSDSNDVDYVVLQINTGASWVDMALDPAGDKNSDGMPGKAGIDDDGDGWADTLDPQVRNAMTTTLAGDAADTSSVTGGDGIYCLNDGIDNNNDGMVDNALDTLYGANSMWIHDDDEDGLANGTTVPTVTYALANGDSVIGRHIDGSAGRGVNYWPYLMHVAGMVVNDTSATIAGDERDSLFPLLQTVIAPGTTGSPLVYSFADLMGFNLNMRLIQNMYSIGNGAEFFVRGVPYDQRGGFIGPKYSPPLSEVEANRTGNHDETVANNICMTVDTTGVSCTINIAKFGENVGADSAVAPNIDYTIWDSDDSSFTNPAEALTYRIEGSCPGAEKDSIVFYYQQWNDSLGTWLGTWSRIGADSDGEPFDVYWTPPAIMDNHPCDKTTRFYFYCQAFGTSGSFEAALADTDTVAAELVVTMVDHVFPMTNITSVGLDSFLTNGAIVPADSAVHITVGGADLNDRDGDATTNDIISIEFQQRRTNSGNGTPGVWYTIGSTATPFDSMPPVDVKWRTDTLSAHNYDLRAVGIDCEGNSNINFTQVVSVTIDTLGLRAYIEPAVVLTDSTIQLHAQVFIHDVEVDNVQFQTWPDSNANCLPDENVSWLTVATDDNDDSTSSDPGGDVTLRVGSGTYATVSGLASPQNHRAFPDSIGFIDYDGDGYSPLDPVVFDSQANGLWTLAGSDSVIIGALVGGDSLTVTNFAANEFYADLTGNGMTSDDWIFGDNLGGITMYGTDSLETYTAVWFSGDISGSWLVRALATDELGNPDTDSNTAIPFICVPIDNDYPEACIATIALGDGGDVWSDAAGGCLDAVDSSVCGNNSFLYVCAALNDTSELSSLAWIKFQWSVDNINWNDLDINDDDDMYADVDDTLGFSGGDAIVRDDYGVDQTFMVDASDLLLRNGIAGTLGDLYGQRLYPLIGEDVVGGGDADGDGSADEDTMEARDFRAPYCAYIDIDALTSDTLFRTSTLLYLRALAQDDNGNPDPSPTVTTFTIMENNSPETDIVWAITEDGDTVDVYPSTQDADGGDQFGALTDTLMLHVTVQDTSATDSVRIWYRTNPNYDCTVTNLTNPWVEATGVVDQVYPFNLYWGIGGLTDGCYQFQVIADNDKCNMSHLRLNPYEFSLLTTTADIIHATRPLAKAGNLDKHRSTVLDVVTKGSELWIQAELTSSGTPLADEDASVTFYYSDRVLGELLTVQSFYPYISDSVVVTTLSAPGTYAIFGSETVWASDVEVIVNDSLATFHTAAAFDLLASPTKYDYKVTGKKVQFGAQLASTDSAWVSYNYGGWSTIQDSPDNDVDGNGYFTTAWDPTAPVPDPKTTTTDAFDLIATVSYADDCGTTCVSETQLSEGKVVIVEDAYGPEVTLHGFFWDEESPFTRYNYSGNPLRKTNGDHQKTKLCGIEYDAFVLVDSVVADSVKLAFDGGTSYDLTHYVEGDTITMTISMQEDDYLLDSVAIFVDSIENVQLYWNNEAYYTMYDDGTNGDVTAGDGWWAAQVAIVVTSGTVNYPYQFDIDMSGDEKIVSDDRRHSQSRITVTSDFWHRSFTTELVDGAHYAVATAWGNSGREGSNLTSAQGPVVFIIDCVAPYVEAMYVDPTIVSHDSDCDTFTITVIVRDGVNGNIEDILAMDEVSFQFATDDSKTRWVELDGETYSGDVNGWVFMGEWPSMYDPDDDNIDNDNDGETDEADEKDYSFSLRVVIKDDGWNTVVFEDGTMRVDLDPPLVVMTSPAQGTVKVFGDSFTVCAQPATDEDAIGLDYYKFYFAESSGVWKTIDPTPIDNTDDERVPANGTEEVCVTFKTDWLDLQEDQYVQFLAVGVDSACNETNTDDVTPVIVAVNDTVGPAACILSITNYCGDTVSIADPHLAVSGDTVYVNGKILDDPQRISIVELWVQPVGGATVTEPVRTTNSFVTGSSVSLRWNANAFATAGSTQDVDVWFLARDLDGNPDPTPLKTRVSVDREAPSVDYVVEQFIDGIAQYDDDGIEDHASNVIVPDPTTGWVTFRVRTADADIASMVLQFRPDSTWNNHLGNWRTLTVGANPANLDFEPQHTEDDMYLWWWAEDGDDWIGNTNIPSGAHMYQWRVKATDYACNTNILDPEFVLAAIDTIAPACTFFGDDAVADGTIGQVAAGDDVMLRWWGCDNDVCDNDAYTFRTDLERVIYWYIAPVSGDTVIIGTDDAPVDDVIDAVATKWTSEITWTTPAPLIKDRTITVGAWAYDTPGNRSECLNTIRVEDKDPPVRTRLVDVTGAACDIYPRQVTETVLNNQTVTWNHTITLVAETAVGDSGIAGVWFMATDPDGDTLEIGYDASATGTVDGSQTVLRWSVAWNGAELDEVAGEPKWKEGDYTVWVYARDMEENYEIPTLTYDFRLDMTEPTAQAAVNGVSDAEVTINRGDMVYVSAVSTGEPDDDIVVTWWMRTHNDSTPGADSWLMMDSANGFSPVDDKDVNPDSTRPYSWEWATWNQVPSLEVGNCYDIVATSSDLVCNEDSVWSAWNAGRGVTFCVIDTTAPCATITHLTRNLCRTTDPVEQPENERVRGFASLTATILGGETDVEKVAFEYSTDGGETWILSDQDLVTYGDFGWRLTTWDSDQVPEGEVLFRAVAFDDVGNSNDGSGCSPAITLIVDRTAPVVAVVAPTEQQCPFVVADDGDHVVPLIVTSSDDQWHAPAGLTFEWKKSVDDTTNWSNTGVEEWLYDAGTGYYTGTWDVDSAGAASGKYDFRVTATDSACNTTVLVMATEVVIDITAPVVNMTNVEIDRVRGTDQTTVVIPISNGVVVDVSAGEPVRLYATATDDEQDIPGSLETAVDSVFFEVAVDTSGTIYHIDLGDSVGDGGLYVAHWNTSALDAGTYWVRARATDECGNDGTSPWIAVNVIDDALPRAAIICWEPDIINDINGTTKVRIYATKWCTQTVDEVMFQYRKIDESVVDQGEGEAGKAAADPWVTFGLQTQPSGNPDNDSPDSLWYAELEIGPETTWMVGDQLELRAVAITLVPGVSGNDRDVLYFDPNPPYTVAKVVADRFNRDLEPVHPDAEPWIAYDKVELIAPSESDFYVELSVSDYVVDSLDWGSIAKPWVLVTADRLIDEANFEEIVEMDPMNNGAQLDDYAWSGFTWNSLLDSIGCGGYVYINAAVVEDSGEADDGGPARIDIIRKVVAVHEVTNGAGSRGMVAIPGDENNLTVTVPSGNGVYGGLLMTTTHTPNYPNWEDQRFWIRPIGQAYKIRLLDCTQSGCSVFTDGYWAEVTIGYTEEDLTVKDYLGHEVTVNETELLVAWWDTTNWDGAGISEVTIDTAANTVSFLSQGFCGWESDVWSLVGITSGNNVEFYPWCNGYTNNTPEIHLTIADFLETSDSDVGIDEDAVELWIDNHLWAGGPGDVDGNGTLVNVAENDDQNVITYAYSHSTFPSDLLTGGSHTLRFRYRNIDEDYWFTIEREFMVDVVPPTVEWAGGFLNGPCVGTADCFVNGSGRDNLALQIHDYEAGVFTQETRIDAVLNIIFGDFFASLSGVTIDVANANDNEGGDVNGTGDGGDASGGITNNITVTTSTDTVSIPIQDMGLKMDVWLVDDEDDQTDIDEYWERALIQSATPAMLTYSPELCEWSDPAQCDPDSVYDPSDDMWVSLPLTVNLKPYDGREIEVVLYSTKVEHIGLDINTGDEGTGDDDNEEFTKYIFGPFDCVGNVGSQYVARRFIIDTSAPTIAFNTPVENSVVAPGSVIPIDAVISDGDDQTSGSGINESTIRISLTGPDGVIWEELTVSALPVDDGESSKQNDNDVKVSDTPVVTADGISMNLVGIEEVGLYTLTIEGEDNSGNGFNVAHSWTVGASVLQITDAQVWPNPVNPDEGEQANISFFLGGQRPSDVEISIYDFAGDLVWSGELAGQQGQTTLQWAGTTDGGTTVASGGYIARIVANDGAATKTATVKVAIRKFGGTK